MISLIIYQYFVVTGEIVIPGQQQFITKRFRNASDKNLYFLRNMLQNVSRENCRVSDVNLAYETFRQNCEADLNNALPVTIKQNVIHNNKYRPWMTHIILIAVKTKNRLYKHFLPKIPRI